MKKKIAVFAGSFDPFTKGHLDIADRSLNFCDELVIAIGINSQKKTLFSEDERIAHIKNYINGLGLKRITPTNVKVGAFQGLLIDYAKHVDASVLIRGIRNAADFEYENNLSIINRQLNPSIETVFLSTQPEKAHVSSSAAKELARCGAPINQYVNLQVALALYEKFNVNIKNDGG